MQIYVDTKHNNVSDPRGLRAGPMMHPRKSNPRAEYRLLQNQRAKDSACLAEKFPGLGSLTVSLAYFDSEGFSKHSELKYRVNVQHAKSMFCFVCPSSDCVGGDFDLSGELAKAVAAKAKLAAGELRCAGWHKTPKVERVPCEIVLRYKLSLDYV